MPSVDDNGSDGGLIDRATVAMLASAAGGTVVDAPITSGDGLPPLPSDAEYAIKVISSTMTATGPEYVVKRMMGGGSTTNSGLMLLPDTTYLARNVADDLEVPDAALPDGTVILNARVSVRDSKQILIFDVSRGGSLPTGEYEYMVYQMGADNQAVFDFSRAHPIVSG